MQFKADLLAILRDAYNAIKSKQYWLLHGISNHIIHSMSVYQQAILVDSAVAIYALSKILRTEKYRRRKDIRRFEKEILKLLERAISSLEQDKIEDYEQIMKTILGHIQSISKKVKLYIEDVLHFAKIKKGTRLYEHGVSLGRAAEMLGITKWELMPKIGETTIYEKFVDLEKDKKRIKLVKKLFKK